MSRVPIAIVLMMSAAHSVHADVYPLSYADRPLALPSTNGVAGEAIGLLRFDRRTSYAFDDQAYNGQFLDMGGRAAVGKLELSASASLLLHDTGELSNGVYFPGDRLRTASGGARLAITPNVQVGAEITRFGEGDLVSHYAPRALVVARLHAASGAAIDLGAFIAYDHLSEHAPNGPVTTRNTSWIAGAEVRVIAQIEPSFALEARFALMRIAPIEQPFGLPYTDLTEDYGLRAIKSVSPVLDLIADAHFPLEGEKQFSVGASYRVLP